MFPTSRDFFFRVKHCRSWLNVSLMADWGSLGSKWPIASLDEFHLSLTLSLSALLHPRKRPAVVSLWTQGSDGKHTLINSMYYSCCRPSDPLRAHVGHGSCPGTDGTGSRGPNNSSTFPHLMEWKYGSVVAHLRCIWVEDGEVVLTFDSEHILLNLTIGHVL